MKSSVKIIATNDIHKQYLDREFKNVSIVKNSQNAIILLLEDKDITEIFLNGNSEINFTQNGFTIEGFALIKENLGKMVVLIQSYETNVVV